MPRALITGITGQDGRYLAELLHAKGYAVHGLVRGQSNPKLDLLQREHPYVSPHFGDLTDLSSLLAALDASQPDEIYNLGAISSVPHSWSNPGLTTDVTARGALNLLEAVRMHAGPRIDRIRYYQASSSEMFGAALETPQRETTRFWPRSPYGVAKAYAHHITVNYRESYGLHASCGILFNHESPRRGHEFVTRKVTTAVARIHLGLQQTLALGALDTSRDWGYAGDYVEAMWRMLQQPDGDDYVIATGRTHTIRQLLDTAFACVGIDDWTPYVSHDPAQERPAEVDYLLGDASKAREVLGWSPTVGFAELIHRMVDHDLAEHAGQTPGD